MKQFVLKHKRWFAYSLYGVLLTIVLLYVRFPSDAVRHYLQANLDKAIPGLGVSIGRVSPSNILGLKLMKAELFRKGNPKRVFFKADKVVIRPVIWSYLQGKFKLCFDGLAYGGGVKGCVQFKDKTFRSPFDASIELKDVRADNHADLSGLLGRSVKGRVGGRITYSGAYNALINGTGEADLTVSQGLIELLEPILMLESIDFDDLQIKMILKNQNINLTRVEFKGPNLRGTLSGTVGLKKELLKSSLNLRGTIEPFADFFKSLAGTRDTVRFFKDRLKRGRLSFMIGGTLTDPKIRFI